VRPGAAAFTSIVLAATVSVAAVEHPSRLHQYRKAIVNKRTLAAGAAHAALGEVTGRPREWGRGPGGIAKRFGSGVAQHVVKGTIEFGVATAHHEDLHYRRSNLRGTWPRLKYAVKSTFIVPKTNRPGRKTVALGRISGNLGAGIISRAWQPASTAGLGAGVASGGIGIGADVGINVAREFWPRKHRRRIVHTARRPLHKTPRG